MKPAPASRDSSPLRLPGRMRLPGRLGDPRFRAPSRAMVDALFEQIRAFPNVRGCFVGRRARHGRLTAERSLVCCVERKVHRRELDPRQELLPRRLQVRMGRRVINLRTDVIAMPPLEVKVAAVAGPGDEVATTKGRATIGVALNHPLHGSVVTTAGHLVYEHGEVGEETFSGGTAPAVSLLNAGTGKALTGRVRRVVVSDKADYALVQLDGGGASREPVQRRASARGNPCPLRVR